MPGEQVEAFVARGTDSQIIVREQTVEAVTHSDSGGVGVRVVVDGRVGFAHTSGFGRAALAQVVADARDNARHTDRQGPVGLPGPDGTAAADIDLWSQDCVETGFGTKVALCRELERLVTASPAVRGVKSVRWGDAAAESAVVSTEGVASYSRRTSCFLSTYVLGTVETGGTSTATGHTVARAPAGLDLPGAAREALGALPLSVSGLPRSQVLPVLFDPAVTAAFLTVVCDVLHRRPVRGRGQAFGAEEPGAPVASPHVTLVDDPTDPLSFGAARYDAEGMATRRNILIDRGRAAHRLHDSSSAGRAGAASNGAAVRAGYKSLPRAAARALSLMPGGLDRSALIAGVSHGFLVQSISGLAAGTDPLRGSFSAAASGRMIRNGEPAEYVPHCTLASTLTDALGDISATGADVRAFPGQAKGMTVLIGRMSLGTR
nr:TldD/PmbA family protein [Streptomyces sp. SID9727]